MGDMRGFLGAGATFAADLNLILQVGMGLMLLAGMGLARHRNYRAHGRCQSAVVLLNLLLIASVMAPSFHRQVSPNLHRGLSDPYYTVAVIHALLGTVAELLGLYVILVAGTTLIPERFRFRRYKPWMRTTLGLWWMVIVLGLGTYFIWYVAPDTRSPDAQTKAASASAPASTVTVTVQNFSFGPDDLTIKPGTTVVWTDTGGRHSVENEDQTLKSQTLVSGDTFQKVFNRPGVYDYYCGVHGKAIMHGRITVSGR